jgi:hypothetical protein
MRQVEKCLICRGQYQGQKSLIVPEDNDCSDADCRHEWRVCFVPKDASLNIRLNGGCADKVTTNYHLDIRSAPSLVVLLCAIQLSFKM